MKNQKCEICKEKELSVVVIKDIYSNPLRSFNLCLECNINFLVQYYKLENNEVEEFIKWIM